MATDAPDPAVATGAAGPSPAAPSGLLAAAEVHGALTWVARRSFELLGSWSTSLDDPRSKVLAAVHADQHAWHGDLWFARLPQLREIDVDALVAPPDGLPELFAQLEGFSDDRSRLAGFYRGFLPRLQVRLRSHLTGLSSVADGPALRAGGFVTADLIAHRDQADEVLAALLHDPDGIALAGEAAVDIEQRWLAVRLPGDAPA